MNILESIVDHKREEVATHKGATRVSDLMETELYASPVRSLSAALKAAPLFGIIAEFKRSSPSAGVLNGGRSPAAAAREYASAGAAAVSVLTDERFFSGTLADLRSARGAVGIPLLRKDFIIDEYQLYEARASGADAVLLIAAILDKLQLADLHDAAIGIGLEALVELYDEREVDLLDQDRMRLVGVNNRDLRSFEVDLNRTLALAGRLRTSDEVTVVSESGIRGSEDLRTLLGWGVRAALIGELLMKSALPEKALRDLLLGVGRESEN
jgi:indole-3-glycerol phosphate synthase